MEHVPTVLLIALDDDLVRRFGQDLSDRYHVRSVDDPAAAADAAQRDVALVVLDGRPAGATVDHLLATVREHGFDGPALAVVDADADSPNDDVDHYLVEPLDETDLRAAVEGLAPVGAAEGDATVFDALGDPKGRRCCRVLLEEAHSARALADATGYSLPTVYRRLDALESAGLVRSSTRIRTGGGNYEVYRAVTTAVRIVVDDGFRVEFDRPADEPEA